MAKKTWYSIAHSMGPGDFPASLCFPSCCSVLLFRCSSLLSGNSLISLAVFKQPWCNNGWKSAINMLSLTSVHFHMLFPLFEILYFFLLHLSNFYLYFENWLKHHSHWEKVLKYINIVPITSDTLISAFPYLPKFTWIRVTVIVGLFYVFCTIM